MKTQKKTPSLPPLVHVLVQGETACGVEWTSRPNEMAGDKFISIAALPKEQAEAAQCSDAACCFGCIVTLQGQSPAGWSGKAITAELCAVSTGIRTAIEFLRKDILELEKRRRDDDPLSERAITHSQQCYWMSIRALRERLLKYEREISLKHPS